MEIIFLEPIFKQMLWGGNRLREKFGYAIPGEDTGECWAISAHPSGDCQIRGAAEGMTLSRLWKEHKELFGNAKGEVFPLLTKIIDAKEDLSIQVHPNDAYAKGQENGSLGKTECWYVLDCEPDAKIVIGHYARTREELEKMIYQGRWKDLIREVPIQPGDFFQIEPGCIHAIKGGTLILETQQNSDITYRVYDYDRLSNGKKRELHIEKSLDVITVPYKETLMDVSARANNSWMQCLITCDYYTVWKAKIDGEELFVPEQDFMLVSVLEGEAYFGDVLVKSGEHFIIPVGMKEMTLKGKVTFIIAIPVNMNK